LAAGLAAVAGAPVAKAAERPLTENDVTAKTPDGNCDAAFIHPTTGSYPGVLIWADDRRFSKEKASNDRPDRSLRSTRNNND
jgi:hypothetical protein